jgi:glycosyltransferase involved in cell wall biosynthesis
MLSDVIVLPSARETIPLVFLEAWAFKKPVIGSYLPTISSITLTGEKSAHLIPFGDVRKLIEAMHILIEDKKTLIA